MTRDRTFGCGRGFSSGLADSGGQIVTWVPCKATVIENMAATITRSTACGHESTDSGHVDGNIHVRTQNHRHKTPFREPRDPDIGHTAPGIENFETL